MAEATQYKVPKEIVDKLNFVNGERVTPKNASHKFKVIAPYNGQVLVECSASGPQDVDAAVQAAKAAFPEWSKLTGLERGTILHKAADLIKANLEDIARLESTHNGKPIYEARIDIFYAAETINYYASLAPTITGDHIPMNGQNFIYTRKEPLGVCGGIGAWNYPFQTCTWKCGPALAAGNAFVYKPSPWAPLTPVVLGEILTAAGVPKGIFNVVQGERDTGEALCAHPEIAKISFTGSVPTGQRIMEVCAHRGLKRVTLELGGKSPLIIFEDADLENAIKGALNANYFTQGEVCSNASRVFVQRNLYDTFLQKVVERVKKIKPGNPLKDDTIVGATITEVHLQKILRYIESAKTEGAKIECGGERITPDDAEIKNGLYFAPTVISNLRDDMTVVKEEIFGAVMLVLPFDNEEEVIKRANDTPYGLAAGLFTNNVQKAHRVAAQLQAGYVWINNYNVQPVEAPFGGYKISGFGRELGKEALDGYLNVKSVYVELGDVETLF
jgi:aldehyde dehydrogenase family 9 protein A1